MAVMNSEIEYELKDKYAGKCLNTYISQAHMHVHKSLVRLPKQACYQPCTSPCKCTNVIANTK